MNGVDHTCPSCVTLRAENEALRAELEGLRSTATRRPCPTCGGCGLDVPGSGTWYCRRCLGSGLSTGEG